MTPAELRQRLTEMRADLAAALARDGIEPGYLSLMAGIAATLDALERMEAAPAGPGGRGMPMPPNVAGPQRGGDPKAEYRSARNEAVRALGALLSADLSLEQQAREIASKVGRYRPSADDEHGDAERQALHQIHCVGLLLPGIRQLRRILGGEVPGRS
jgi:hypothetical protein